MPGVTAGTLRPELAAIAVPSTTNGGNMNGDDFALTAGWGHLGTGDAVMPGTGEAVERDFTAAECEALGVAADVLGDTTVDVHLNDNARWSNVPAAVWEYKLGATRSSRNGFPTANTRFWAGTCSLTRFNTSMKPPAGSPLP